MNTRNRSSLLVVIALAALPSVLPAQGLLKRVKKAAKEHIGEVQQAVDAAAAQPAADASAATDATASADAATAAAATPAASESQPPGTGAWLNYDFVPGDRVLFFDDFADDRVGDLPTHEDVTDGNVTVIEVQGKKYFRTTTGADVVITLPEKLPDRFTIEATYASSSVGNPLKFTIGSDGDSGDYVNVYCYTSNAGIDGHGANGDKHSQDDIQGIGKHDIVHCRFMFDKGYVKAYINEKRLGQLNGLQFYHGKRIEVRVPSADEEEGPSLVTDIRIAEGGKPLYDALSTAGRVSTHGILFATGSARIEGESTPTLKEIGDMLKAHPDLKLTIEGHTDNVGDATSNQTLSEQRAAAVKQFLVSSYGIDAGRLQTKGYGASKPVAANTTPEGRQQNRRVELVKM